MSQCKQKWLRTAELLDGQDRAAALLRVWLAECVEPTPATGSCDTGELQTDQTYESPDGLATAP